MLCVAGTRDAAYASRIWSRRATFDLHMVACPRAAVILLSFCNGLETCHEQPRSQCVYRSRKQSCWEQGFVFFQRDRHGVGESLPDIPKNLHPGNSMRLEVADDGSLASTPSMKCQCLYQAQRHKRESEQIPGVAHAADRDVASVPLLNGHKFPHEGLRIGDGTTSCVCASRDARACRTTRIRATVAAKCVAVIADKHKPTRAEDCNANRRSAI